MASRRPNASWGSSTPKEMPQMTNRERSLLVTFHLTTVRRNNGVPFSDGPYLSDDGL